MKIHDLKIGDKLQVLVENNTRGDYTLNDIIEITHIKKDINNTLWISHTPDSFSGGDFRICNNDGTNGYKLGVKVIYISELKKEKKYLTTLLKKLNIK